MATTTTSQYMLLPVPVPTSDPGPQYATDLNTCLTLIDQHTHSSGSGTQVVSAGININADLSFGGFNQTTIRSARFSVQASPISGGTDLGCVFVSGADLYYNDTAGNHVRLTQSGGVAGTAGSIGNLLSPANLTYVPGTPAFVFQSTTATPANLDAGAIVLRNILANSKGVTLQPAAALANNYTLTLPGALPTSGTKFLSLDSTGNVGDSWAVDNSTIVVSSNVIKVADFSLTLPKLGPIVASSSVSSGTFTTTSLTFVDVTNLSVTYSTVGTGRPVFVGLRDDGTGSNCRVQADSSLTTGTATLTLQILRNSTVIMNSQQGGTSVTGTGGTPAYIFPPSSFFTYNIPSASSAYTYKVQILSNAATTTARIVNCALYVMET